MTDTPDVEDARVDVLARTVQDLLALLKREGGYRSPHQQALMRRARAELVEFGFGVSREDV